MVNTRGVFRNQSNFYDGALLRKEITVFSRQLFSQKSSINVRLGSKYSSEYDNIFFPDFSKLKLMTCSVVFFND